MAPPRTRLMTGSVFAGYRIVRPLGESGARGDLYLATRLATARSCALRVLPAALVADPEGAARFEEVGSLRAGIDSGHVVDLIDAGVDKASGAPW
ncbi:MAG: serine/threonine protein kinase, partial [Deltaproteobacteria bacterium]|nr:serine/threonine protein kinase [Deltaproteobacteria bacterium]